MRIDPFDVLTRIHTYVGGYCSNVVILQSVPGRDGDPLALQVSDRTNLVVGDQLIASAVQSRECDNRLSCIEEGKQI
jgi:hypothetical protein